MMCDVFPTDHMYTEHHVTSTILLPTHYSNLIHYTSTPLLSLYMPSSISSCPLPSLLLSLSSHLIRPLPHLNLPSTTGMPYHHLHHHHHHIITWTDHHFTRQSFPYALIKSYITIVMIMMMILFRWFGLYNVLSIFFSCLAFVIRLSIFVSCFVVVSCWARCIFQC